MLVAVRAQGSGSGRFGGIRVAKGWRRGGSKGEGENERMSKYESAKDGAQDRERENEGNVCERDR